MSARISSGILIALLAASVALMHLAALQGALYWRYRWLDIPMHFAGGFLVASAVLWLASFISPGVRRPVLLALVSALVIGIAWEIFEYASGLTRGEAGYWFDTSHDLAMDLIGALFASLIFPRYAK